MSGYAGNYLPWAVSPDGQRFLVPQPEVGGADPRKTPLTVLVNGLSPRDK